MTLKGYVIFKKNLTSGLKNDIRNLVSSHARSCKSENVHFYGLVLSKMKGYRRVMSHDTKE